MGNSGFDSDSADVEDDLVESTRCDHEIKSKLSTIWYWLYWFQYLAGW
jgi:hypothetical protein